MTQRPAAAMPAAVKSIEAADVFTGPTTAATPLVLVAEGSTGTLDLSDAQRRWLTGASFTGAAKKSARVPNADGSVASIVLGIGKGDTGDPCGPADLLVGQMPGLLPEGTYELGGSIGDPTLAATAWGLGAYRFRRYKSAAGDTPPKLVLPPDANRTAILNTVEAIWSARDLINTPASDLGPAEVEAAVRNAGAQFGANVTSIAGDDLLTKNFPMIHAVGRASPRPPRIIDLRWQKPGGRPDAPSVTLVGKGITFDTGGLDIKPASAMLIMKKDMGGAAAALAIAHMIMGQGIDVRLRLLIASAENSISGDAFRPGDVLKSRAGITVEIGNTDAEGRLVLADAIALAEEDPPDNLFVFATLTGAARSALGPDLPAMFTDDDHFAQAVLNAGLAAGDPVWRLPLWPGYERHLDSDTADMNNVWESPFAGAITAALFLKRFVKKSKRFAHFDLYGWRPAARPLGPKGGEAQTARAVFEVLKREVSV